MNLFVGRVPIESLCLTIGSGGTPSRSDSALWDGGAVPWFKSGELNDGYLVNSEECITTDALDRSPVKLFPSNAVLMAMYGDGKTITTLGILRDEASVNQAICAMVTDPARCNFRYLFYALKHHRRELLKLVVAGAQRNLSVGIIRSFTVRYFPLEVQNRIAEVLSPYDDLIENNQRRMALLEETARQLYREWFERLRFPGHEHVHLDDGVPDGWRQVKFGDLCNNVRQSVLPDDVEPNTPYIGLEHMPRRSIALSSWGHAAQVTSTKNQFCIGDIIFGKIRPYFHKVGISFVDGVASSDAIVIRSAADDLRALVLLTASSDRFVATVSQSVREGSKMPRADWKVMSSYPIMLPPHGILATFNSVIAPILDQLRLLVFSNEKLRAARDLLLPRLMSGELVV